MLRWRDNSRARTLVLCTALCFVAPSARGEALRPSLDDSVKVSEASFDNDRGTWRFTVTSKHQKGENLLEVLLPDRFDANQPHRVLYVLPVETGIGGRYGDGLMEVKKLDAHNKHNLICVAIAFDQLPWFADHATDQQRQHETYITRVVVPFIESKYKTPGDASGRLLLGFSKSGWGAFTLILRNPKVFGKAASWDAPLMWTDYSKWPRGWTQPFGDEATFRKFSPAALIETCDNSFKSGEPRLILLGPGNFKNDGVKMHEAMDKLGIKHTFDNTLDLKHDWHSGWVKPAIKYLVAPSATSNGCHGSALRPVRAAPVDLVHPVHPHGSAPQTSPTRGTHRLSLPAPRSTKENKL